MKKTNIIGIGLISLIPIGFSFKYFFNPESIALLTTMAALAVCVISLTVLHFSEKENENIKKEKALTSNLYLIIMIPAIYLINIGVPPAHGNKFDAFTIISVVTAYSSLCILIGVKIGSVKE